MAKSNSPKNYGNDSISSLKGADAGSVERILRRRIRQRRDSCARRSEERRVGKEC